MYNAIWHELICGRSDVLEKIILWSNSCVPQNRNSLLSFTLQHFLLSPDSGNLKVIEQKFREPGHGNIQEIDAADSCIERFIKHTEIWSPLSLIRTLLKIPDTWKLRFVVVQMTPSDHKNYQSIPGTFTLFMTRTKFLISNLEKNLKENSQK